VIDTKISEEMQFHQKLTLISPRVVYPDPDWIRIGNPDPGARKLRNFSGKMHFSYLKKNFTTKKV
jgi:hypothetical protein